MPAPQAAPSPAEILLEQYQCWMKSARAPSTTLRYRNTARRSPVEQATAHRKFAPDSLTGPDLNTLLLPECAKGSADSAKGQVAELPSLMQFLHLHGIIPMKPGGAVPPIAGWRFASAPPTIATGDINDCWTKPAPRDGRRPRLHNPEAGGQTPATPDRDGPQAAGQRRPALRQDRRPQQRTPRGPAPTTGPHRRNPGHLPARAQNPA